MSEGDPIIPPEFGLKFILASGEERLFTSLPISIGRGDQNDLTLTKDTVSASHAEVYFDDRIQDVCIRDVDSLNGVLIDQKPTLRNVLHDGVRISLGGAIVEFRDTGYIHTPRAG